MANGKMAPSPSTAGKPAGGGMTELWQGILAHLIIQEVYRSEHPLHVIACERRLYYIGDSVTLGKLLQQAGEALEIARDQRHRARGKVTVPPKPLPGSAG